MFTVIGIYLLFYPIADTLINHLFCCFGSDAATPLCLQSQLSGRTQCPAHSNIWSLTHHKLNKQRRLLCCIAITEGDFLQDLRRHLWQDSVLLTPCNRIFTWIVSSEQTRNPRVVPCFYFIQSTPPGVPLHTYIPIVYYQYITEAPRGTHVQSETAPVSEQR